MAPVLARTPPMGWNSWNKFGPNIDEKLIHEVAQALIASGLRGAGFEYVVVDDGWQGDPPVDSRGAPRSNLQKFPSGMKALGDFLHSKQLKFGLFCRPVWVHEREQAAAEVFASWGVDLLKYDFVDVNARETNGRMRRALDETGRPMIFSICGWGLHKPWEWGADIGAQYWRVAYDLFDSWDSEKNSNAGVGILMATDIAEPLGKYAGPGHWNDLDMLVLGLRGESNTGGNGCSDEEYRAHFSLWCLLLSPLMAGNDVRKMDKVTRDILTNTQVIAISQDPLGKPARRVSPRANAIFEKPGGPRKLRSPLEVWSKPLHNGDWALGLLNRSQLSCSITAAWEDLGLSGSYSAYDLWAHKELGLFEGLLSLEVPAHAIKLLRLSRKAR